jgi:hypothetical protein
MFRTRSSFTPTKCVRGIFNEPGRELRQGHRSWQYLRVTPGREEDYPTLQLVDSSLLWLQSKPKDIHQYPGRKDIWLYRIGEDESQSASPSAPQLDHNYSYFTDTTAKSASCGLWSWE